MDINLIIREMAKKGMSEEEIKKNLVELGVENPDAVYAQVMQRIKPMEVKPIEREETPKEKTSFLEEVDLGEEEIKPLFEEKKPLFQEKVTQKESEEKELDVVSVSPKEEETLDIEKMMFEEKTSQKQEVEEKKESKSFEPRNASEKLDAIYSKMVVLEELFKKILETNREIVYRLKK